MQSVTATFRNGRIELSEAVDWPEGTPVEVIRLSTEDRQEVHQPMSEWPNGFFDRLRERWGDEPFERPPQGDFETREDW